MNQSNPLQTQAVNRGEASTRIAFWGTIIQAAILVLAFVGISLLASSSLRVVDTTTSQSGTDTAWFALVVFISLAVVNILSIVLTVRGRQDIGYGLTYFSLTIFLLSAILIVQGRALFLSSLLLLPAVLGIGWICPPRSRRFYIFSTIVAFALAWAIEWVNPPWRTAYAGTPISSIVAIAFLIIFGALVLIQSRTVIASRLQLQFIVWTGAIIAVLSIIIIAYSVVTSRQTAIDDAQQAALAISEAHANEAANQLAPALNAARTLASTLKAVKDQTNPIFLSRNQVNGILKQVAEENPNFLGTWTTWEPNAYDGLDAQYANTPLHDETGRFIPYWVRSSSGEVEGVAIVDYETPGLNDWYNIPRVTKREAILTPYFYPIDGVDVLLTSMAVPIVVNGQFYGVAGADLKIDFLQTIVDDIDLYNGTAVGVLLTEEGTLIAVGNQPELALKPASSVFSDFEQVQPQIAAGEAFFSVSPDGKYLRAFAPIKAGEATGSDHWSLGLIIPFSEITAQATILATRQIIVSLVIIALSLIALWYLIGQFTRPLQELTTVANSISAGDLNATANIQSENELGILANTFNAMTSRLREILQGMEQRVADRTRNLELAAEVGRSVSKVRSLDVMLKDAAEIIRSQFDLYYVQVYLLNPSQTYLELKGGTGNVGEQLLGRNHRLPFNTGSINGRAAMEKRPIVISHTSESASFKPNPLLPETKSEMAVPLLLGDQIIGVLDMQSENSGALNKELIPAFEALAGQLAIATQNANLLDETKRAQREVQEQIRKLASTNWREYMDAVNKPEHTGFSFDGREITVLSNKDKAETSSQEDTISALIEVTGEAIGKLVVEGHVAKNAELVNIVAQQVAQHIEGLRLLESAERYRAEAENAVRRLTREGWQSYMEAKENPTLGYMYDLNEVLPVAPNSGVADHSISLPLKSRNETLGQLAVDGVEADDQEALELVNSIAERLSSHIENLRLLDETEKQRAEAEALVRELDIQKYALDQHSIVAITDVTGKIIYANDKFAEISKYSHDEIIGQDHRMLNSGYHPKEFIRDLWVTIANGKVWHGEVKNRAKDGSLYWVDTTIVPILNEKGKPERYLAIRTDVTQRKNDEIQREKRAEELQSVAEIATKASSVSDVNEMLNVVVESTKSAFELYHSHIYLLDESQTNLVLTAGAGEPGRQMVSEKRTIALDHERSLVARSARTNQGAISNDVTQEPDFLPNPLLPDTKSEMAIPISISDKVLGVLDIQADYVGRFSNEDISIITTLAQQIATSLQNARTFAQAQQQADREARLNIISQKIQSATTVDAVLQIAARELGHTLGAPITIAQLGLVDKSNGDNGNNNS